MKRVLVTGGTGFVGRALVSTLTGRGDEVVVLTRDPSRATGLPKGARAAPWTPDKSEGWAAELEKADAVVHLAGENVIGRWTDAKKRAIRASRVEATRTLVDAIGKASNKPGVLVSASAVGYYGPRGADETLDETASSGAGFLADVVREWEREALRAKEHGVRTACLRIGVVLGDGGGALDKMLLPFKLFAGGPVGDGKQIVSWIHRDDVVGLILLALDDERVEGPMNASAPSPASGTELAKAVGRSLGRPSWLPAPAFAIKLAMGEAAEVLTTGQRVVPKRALDLGYAFRYAELGPALDAILKAPAAGFGAKPRLKT